MKFDVEVNAEVHNHQHSDPALLNVVSRLGVLEGKVTAMHEEFKTAVTRLDKATTEVGARLDKLATEIKGGLSAAEAAPIVAELTALGDRLEAMGKDVNNPDPVPMPSE